ncbi:anti-sigma factor domain-containing protein [Sphingomonas sp. GCM10030256]|uniref:anti-sigma factor n=1 Tax=Sphingomonas sp. GCM10030256 TaxID=3273427 RepID=UPI003617FFE3
MTYRESLAAEHALRLLEGEELMEARRLEATDPAFERDVRAWEERLAPLLDEISPVEPGEGLWQRIEFAIRRAGGSDNVVQWQRKVRRWQGLAGLASAAAVALGLLAVTPLLRQPAPRPRPAGTQQQAPMMVATLAMDGAPGAIAVTYMPNRRSLLVNASGVAGAAGHDHELWVIPDGGTPRSLGVMRRDRPSMQQLEPLLAAQLRAGAGIALSVEPTGGSPTGQPTGPVVASGSLSQI